MPDDRDVFAALTALVLERRASPEDLSRFRELLRAHPAFIEIYRRQVMIATLLPALSLWEQPSGNACDTAADPAIPENDAPQKEVSRRGVAWWLRTAVAAAVLVLLAGAAVRLGVDTFAKESVRIARGADNSPLRVLRQDDAAGLELPGALPGTLRLESGEVTVRLTSGVELTLLGPLELEVRDAMRTRLLMGRVLADVPPVASGFMVTTPALEMWDLGTVFGVSVANGVSDVFVFQGSVQVNEVSGEPVDLCVAGEGVRAAPGQRPYKVAADWPEAQKLFGYAEGRRKALQNPAAAFSIADRIAEQWGERYLPTVMPPPPPPVPGLRGNQRAVASGQWPVASRQSASGVLGPASKTLSTTTVVANGPPAQQEETQMKATNTVAALAAATVLGIVGAARAAVPEVSGVTMAQREGSRIVDIGYTLSGEAAIVTLAIETNGVAIPDSAVTRLSGDVSVVVQPGADKHIVWNAGADWPENVADTAKARVTAWSVDAPPLYCAVDVVGGSATDSYPVTYYPSAEGVPGGARNDLYKTTRILMRKIPETGAGGFKMGSPPNETGRDATCEDWHDVTLTKGFYAGVYQVTQSQWQQVMGDVRPWPAKWNNNDYKLTRPVEQMSYYDIRENIANTDDPAVDWPANDAVTAGSFMGRLRSKTGLAGFDLPTEAQWEYACRAGTSGALNDGTANITNSNSNARLDLLGRYQYDGGKVWSGTAWADPATDCTTANATAAVGSYAPNAWGLYDMHGNVWEWCLDWFGADGHLGTGAVTDPVGADSGSSRVRRGGCWGYTASSCRSASRSSITPSIRSNGNGFRLVRTL